MVKLVISDMDGTLIDRDEVLPKKAVEMAHALREKGILFTIATGRVECMAEKYVQELDIQIPYIACNGVTIVQGDTVLKRNKIPLKGLQGIIRKADEMGMSLVYSIDGKELGKYLKQESNKNSKGTSNSTLSLDDVNIKSMKGSRTLNDKDLPLKESITLVVENKKKSKTNNNMFSGLTNGKTTVKINVTYKNPGKSVSVTLPKDLSSYKLQKK